MKAQENKPNNGIKARPINQRRRLSPAKRREQIAREAATLITQYGSYGFPMQTLADAVGMTLPGLNHYVKNREEMLALVIESFYDIEDNDTPIDPAGIPATITPSGTSSSEPDGNKTSSAKHHEITTPATSNGPHLPSALRKTVERNAQRPELVALFMRLAIEAADQDHPAHEFYRNRHHAVLGNMTNVHWDLPEAYRDQEQLHDLIVTAFFAMDGVQIQSLTNPDESMLQLWERAERILFPSPTWDGYR